MGVDAYSFWWENGHNETPLPPPQRKKKHYSPHFLMQTSMWLIHIHIHIHILTQGYTDTWATTIREGQKWARVKMLYSCMYASFVSCYCILVEKIDDKYIFLTPSLTFPVFESDHFGNSNMWPVGMLRAIVGSPLTHWGRTTHICVNKISS